jgi:outer membrane protein OmpA-like peptidoglycan-associated protein
MPYRFLPFTAVAVLLPALAAAQTAGPYVSLGVGVDILQNEIAKPYDGYGPSKRAFQFSPGLAGEAAFGYGFGNGLRLEIEGDYARNALDGVKFPNGVQGRYAGAEPQFGGFANFLYDLPLGLPITPYVGAGAGYQDVQLDRVSTGGPAYHPFSKLTPSEGAFAYQGIAGVSYVVPWVQGLSLTAEYHLIGVLTPQPYYRGDPGNNMVYYNGVLQESRSTVNNIFNHEALIGLRYSFGAPPPPSPPPANTEAAPPAPPTRTYLVFFDWDRADLTDRARQIVAEAAAASTHVPTTRIDVNGYTDLSGSAAYNQRLSVRRAESVESELVRDGVPKTEIVISGFGETNPLVPTAKGVRAPQNRRVEIILH